ncbi:MAG: GAF domain-containing protein [Candidatus Ratteibacteria bacterium]|jgi:signal transduction protein with GAF and PtsI domain
MAQKKAPQKAKIREHSTAEILNALSKVSAAISSDLYLEDVLRLIVTVTAGVMNSKICSLMILNDKKELEIKATQSINPEYIRKPNLKMGEGIAGKVAIENRPIVVFDVQSEKEYIHKDLARKEGLASLLSVPLAVRGKVIGVLNTYTSTPHEFSEEEIEILQTVASQAAVTIDNTHLIVKTRVIEEELEGRKMIERAKGILMRKKGLGEEEAFRFIQKESMDRRTSMRQVAEALILGEQLQK